MLKKKQKNSLIKNRMCFEIINTVVPIMVAHIFVSNINFFERIFLSLGNCTSYQCWMSPHCFLFEAKIKRWLFYTSFYKIFSRAASKYGRCYLCCFLSITCSFFMDRTQGCHVHPYLLQSPQRLWSWGRPVPFVRWSGNCKKVCMFT